MRRRACPRTPLRHRLRVQAEGRCRCRSACREAASRRLRGGARSRPLRRPAPEGKTTRTAGGPVGGCLSDLTERARRGEIDPLIGREAELDRLIHVLCRRRKNNPVLVGDPGAGKTAIVEGLALAIARGAGARPAERGTHPRARCRGAPGGHLVARRVRGAPDRRHLGDPGRSRRDPVHRRDPHDRGRRELDRQRARCVEPAQAGSGGRHCAASARPRSRSTRPRSSTIVRSNAGSRRSRSSSRRPTRPCRSWRASARATKSTTACGSRPTALRAAVELSRTVHARAAAARQGHRPDRRGGRRPAAGGRPSEATGRRRARDRGGGGEDGGMPVRTISVSDQERLRGSGAGLKDVIFGQDEAVEALVRGDQDGPRRPASAGQADRVVPVLRPDGSGQDGAGQAAGPPAGSRVPALRHERVHGEAHGVAADRRAARVRRLRPGRPAHRRRAQDTRTPCWCSTRSRRRTRTSSTSCCR